MHSSTPNLFRAVAECTQPYGPPVSGSSVRSLQSYLANDRCVDSVYRAILARACAEPQSEAVLAKCIALIKQYVTRHTPSAAVLEAIAAACQRLAAALPAESGLQRSLVYLENSVARLAGTTLTGKRVALLPPRPGSGGSSRPWLQAAVNGELGRNKAQGSPHSMQSSTSEEPTAVSAALQVQRAAGSSPVRGCVEQQGLQLQLKQQQRVTEDEDEYLEQLLVEAVRVVPSEPCLPEWTFQRSALQELWVQPLSSLEQRGELDWSLLLPQYSCSLVPLVEGLPGMEVLHMLSSRDIINSITDADQETQLRQMREIAEVWRTRSGATPELLQSAIQQSRVRSARRLFQPLPYLQQEHIDVSSTDVAAVVEVMCGKATPATPSAITGTAGLEDPALYWQQRPMQMLPGGHQQQQQPLHTESIGQISSCILMKLIVDLWLSAGGAVSFPLVLRMLQQALYQAQPEYRVNAFNIIYNLALHGSMLMPARSSHPLSPTAKQLLKCRAAAGGGGGSSSLLQQQQQYQQQVKQLSILQRQLQQEYSTPAPSAAAVHRDQTAAAAPAAAPAAARRSSASSSDSDGAYAGSHGGSSGSQSPLGSPRIHLPLQLLNPPQPGLSSPRLVQQQQQQQQTPYSMNMSPPPSPHSRSRLSRSDLRSNSDPARAQGKSDAEQQQQHQAGSSSNIEAGGGQQPVQSESADAAEAGCTRFEDSNIAKRWHSDSSSDDDPPPIEVAWEAWLQQLLYELLLMLAMVEEPCQEVWQAAVGCLLHLTTHSGYWVAGSLSNLPPAAAAALLDASMNYNWSQELHSHLVQMAVNLLYVTEGPAEPAINCSNSTAAAAVGQVVAGRPKQQDNGALSTVRGWSGSPGHSPPRRQQQQKQQLLQAQQQDKTALGADASAGSGGQRQLSAAGTAAAAGDAEEQDSPYSSSTVHCADQAQGQPDDSDLYLPCQLHGGPVDEQQLAAFGGPQKLLKHFCYAASVEAQRTLLVPLLQVLMPQEAPDASQLAVLQALCANPNCLAAVQATLSAGLPGWADPILSAVAQLLEDQELDLQLLATVLLRLEGLAVAQTHLGSELPFASQQQKQHQAHLPDTAANAAAAAAAADLALGLSLPVEVEAAMQVTLHQLAGKLTAQQQHRPGPQGSAGTVVYVMPAEVQGSWKALKALCWCDDELARKVARQWLQQLLALTLQQSLKGAILLPLPGVVQRPVSAPPAAAAAGNSSSSGSTVAACVAAAINAACECWVDVLVHLVSHCPKGPDAFVDALQLHITCCKLQLGSDRPNNPPTPLSAAAAATAAAIPVAAAAGAPGSLQEQQQQRAAVARVCVQAWAFVCQWVMQAKTSSSQAALTRLAAMAQSLACVPEVPDRMDALPLTPETRPAAPDACAAAGGGDAASAPLSRSIEIAQKTASGGMADGQRSSSGGAVALGDVAAVSAATGVRPLAAAAAAAAGAEDDAASYKGVPPPEPSSEPSALAALWAAEGHDCLNPATAAVQGHGWGHSPEVAAAAAVFAAAEAVCLPQAFLLGRVLLSQQMAQVLSGASLALLLVRLLQCKPHSKAADRGFHGRASTCHMPQPQPLPAAAAAGSYHTSSYNNSLSSNAGRSSGWGSSWRQGSCPSSVDQGTGPGSSGVLPCPVFYPWSDGRQDLQLGLMLMLMSSCSSEAENFVEFGLEAVTQQVLSRCSDSRACLLASQFMLEHLMKYQQERYWTAVRQLVATAQQANDERLLGNPFLQLTTLLSQQQQQQQQVGDLGAGHNAASAAGTSNRSPLGLGMGWSSGARM